MVLLLGAVVMPHAAAPYRQPVQISTMASNVPIDVLEPRSQLFRHAAPMAIRPDPPVAALHRPVSHVTPRLTRGRPHQVLVGTGQWGLINRDRQAAGLAPLQWSPCLATVASQQAARMAAQGFISHANGRVQDLGCHLGTRTGENIGYQWGSIDDAGMNAWFMGDAPHRANILGPYRYVGVAWVWGANHTAYLAVEFG